MNLIFGMEASNLVILFDKFGINVPLLVLQIINFLLVTYLLYRFVFKNVIDIIDKRNQQIQDGLKYSEEMKKEMDNIEQKRSDLISKANVEAESIVHTAQKAAADIMQRQEIESKELAQNIISKANVDIENERNIMFSKLKGDLKDIVVQTVEKVLTHELTDTEKHDYQQKAVEMLIEAV